MNRTKKKEKQDTIKKANKTKAIKQRKKTKKISVRMLICIIPILLIGMIILTWISTSSSRKIIETQNEEQMDLQLSNNMKEISEELNASVKVVQHVADIVGMTYQNESLDTYTALLSKIIYEEDFIYGGGIWFAPNAYDPEQRYVAPFVYKDGDTPKVTYDYSNKSYDYVNQTFYQKVAKGLSEVYFTTAFYDKTMDTLMVTCSVPMYSQDERFMGCVTMDITLDTIQKLIGNVKVQETGSAFLITDEGVYLYSEDTDKIMKTKITQDENALLAQAGSEMLVKDSGTGVIKKNGADYQLYYATLPDIGWKLGITIQTAELNRPIQVLQEKLVLVAAILIVLLSLVIWLQVTSVAKEIKHVKDFAVRLAGGDYATNQLTLKRKDELGEMGGSLNRMYGNNKEMITSISVHSVTLTTSSGNLKQAVEEVENQFMKIGELLRHVHEDMTTSGAATEEVNAAVEEVNSSIAVLANEIEHSMNLSSEIKERAMQVQENSQNSYQMATNLAQVHRKGLEKSIENTVVVQSIGKLAEVISNIAEEINLLSLNASIEAARAGEQGKGFAVVAGEIGKLAGETSQAVNQIQRTVGEVQKAFENLVGESSNILDFLTDTVTPDYDNFVQVAKQYEADANSIKEFSAHIEQMSNGIDTIIHEVSEAIGNVAESAQSTAESSDDILTATGTVSDVIREVTAMSATQESIAQELKQEVEKFILE